MRFDAPIGVEQVLHGSHAIRARGSHTRCLQALEHRHSGVAEAIAQTARDYGCLRMYSRKKCVTGGCTAAVMTRLEQRHRAKLFTEHYAFGRVFRVTFRQYGRSTILQLQD